MKKRRLPPVRHVRTRKGNHPSNPYADEAAAAALHEDRPGWPFAARKADLSDEAQLGGRPPAPPVVSVPSDGGEPTFTLRASDPMAPMVVRFWANANRHAGGIHPADFEATHALAAEMDAWRMRNSGGG